MSDAYIIPQCSPHPDGTYETVKLVVSESDVDNAIAQYILRNYSCTKQDVAGCPRHD